jgi:alpha-amylase/alpha-mannosidase (GH57 family)
MEKIAFLFYFHNHPPVGNFLRALENAYEKAYFPFVDVLKKYPSMKISIHYSGILWDFFKGHNPEFFKILSGLVRTSLSTETVSLFRKADSKRFSGGHACCFVGHWT